MKKVFLLGLVLVLLSLAAVPVMAAGPNNGHGNGNKSGQASNSGDQAQNTAQTLARSHSKANSSGFGKGNTHTGNRQKTPFYLQGTITAIDSTAKTLTVSVLRGNARVKLFIGTDLVLNTSATTKIFKLTQQAEAEGLAASPSTVNAPDVNTPDNNETPADRVAITFDQLAVGDKVAIHGNVVGTAFNATLITLYVTTINLGPVSVTPVAPATSSESLP